MATMKTLLSRAAEIKQKITDKELFHSNTFITFMQNVVNGLTSTFSGKATLTMYEGNLDETACTDASGNIRLNLNNPFIQSAKRQNNLQEMFAIYVGLALHEIGHILFTPMSYAFSIISGVKKGIKIPQDVPFLNAQIMENQKSCLVIANLLMQFFNIVEDAHIEYRLLETFKGYADYLKHMRLRQFRDRIPISVYNEERTPTANVAFNLLLDFSMYGYLPSEHHPGKIPVEIVSDDVIRAIKEKDGPTRIGLMCVAFDKFFSLLFNQLKEETEQAPSDTDFDNTGNGQPSESGFKGSGQENNAASHSPATGSNLGNKSSSGKISERASKEKSDESLETSPSKGTESETSDPKQDDAKDNAASSKQSNVGDSESDTEKAVNENGSTDRELKNESSEQPINNDVDGNSEKSDNNPSGGNSQSNMNLPNTNSPFDDALPGNEAESGGKSEKDSFEQLGNKKSDDSDSNKTSNQEDCSLTSNESESEEGTSQCHFSPTDLIKTLENSMTTDGDNQSFSPCNSSNNESGHRMFDNSAMKEAFERLTEELSKQLAADEEQKERLNGLNTLKDNMNFSQFHENVYGTVNLVEAVPNEKVLSELTTYNAIARRLTRETQRVLEDMREGDVEKGLYFGSRLDRAYSSDKKYFKRYKAEEDVPDMSVIVLIDESGSMRGARIRAVRNTSFILTEACNRLQIRLAVYGHNDFENYEPVTKINVYKDFDDCDGRSLARLSNMRAHNARNRDGWAQRFCVERLRKEDSQRKLLIILSDGAPNSAGYGYCYISPEKRDASYTPKDSGNAKMDIQEILNICYKNHIKVIAAGIGKDAICLSDIYSDGISKRMAATFLQIDNLDELTPQLVKIIKGLVLA